MKKRAWVMGVGLCGAVAVSGVAVGNRDHSNFHDGSLTEAAKLQADLTGVQQSMSDSASESALVQNWLKSVSSPGSLPGWETSGNVKLASQGGNAVVELDGQGSIGQTIIFKEGAHTLGCDVTVLESSAGSELVVTLNGQTLEKFDLTRVYGRLTINLTGNPAFDRQKSMFPPSGSVLFVLRGAGRAKVQLDNFYVY